MLEEPNLIDQLEDQIIDHPSAATKKQLTESSLDETFQKRLNEKANQLGKALGVNFGPNGNDGGANNPVGMQFLITKTHLQYEYRDHGDLVQELNEWFAFNDFSVLGGLGYLTTCDGAIDVDLLDAFADDLNSDVLGQLLDPIVYFSMGSFKGLDQEEQVKLIKKNNHKLVKMGLLTKVVTLLHKFIDSRILLDNRVEASADLSLVSASNYFKLLTLLYFMVNVMERLSIEVRNTLIESDLLSAIFRFIEHWKWNNSHNYRIRYLLLIVWKLLLIELGGSQEIKNTDEFLIKIHNITNKKTQSSALTCSPLDYFTFREDLKDKFPLFNNSDAPFNLTDLKTSLPESDASSVLSVTDNYQYFMAVNNYSNSLSNLLESPRPNKVHTVLSQLPAQTVHIATPVPSPPTTPSDYMSGGEKIRKLYHVNQGMPFIYPNGGTDDVQVPYAIEEADKILKLSIYESYSIKRLWDERQKFMMQERGFVNEYENEKDEDEEKEEEKETEEEKSGFEYSESMYATYPDNHDEIKSLLRVESLYANNLHRLHSVMQVLIETIKSNTYDYNLNFAEMELDPKTSYINQMLNHDTNTADETRAKIEFVIMQQLEVQKIKEITAKASSSIILLLIKWFKINHVLKYYYLTSILFDQQFFNVLMELLNRSFNNPSLQTPQFRDSEESFTEYEFLTSQNKLMNPQIKLPKFEFFNNCRDLPLDEFEYELINKVPITKLPNTLDENNVSNVTITKYNENYCFTLINMLQITNKVLIKNITQRVFILNESKPSEFLKILLLNYDNQYLKLPILKILKKLVPYQGRKWKSINMDLISLIYLNLKLSLKDNWLSGRDLENDFNNSFDQEIALRSLLQFYNVRKYPEQMEHLGYQISTDDVPMLDLNNEEWY